MVLIIIMAASTEYTTYRESLKLLSEIAQWLVVQSMLTITHSFKMNKAHCWDFRF